MNNDATLLFDVKPYHFTVDTTFVFLGQTFPVGAKIFFSHNGDLMQIKYPDMPNCGHFIQLGAYSDFLRGSFIDSLTFMHQFGKYLTKYNNDLTERNAS